MRCFSVHIGGGEPFLNIDGLYKILQAARESGVTIEYIETNSSWFKDLPGAELILEQLQNRGVSTLLVSISPFHNEYIPFKKVIGVLQACRNTGMQIFPWIQDFYSELNSLDVEKNHRLTEYQELFGDHYIQQLANRYWISPGGRALNFFRDLYPAQSLEYILKNNIGGCYELANTSHFHLDLYGHYIPGLCSGLAINRCDLGKPLSEKDYPMLNILYFTGIAGFYKLAEKKYGFVPRTGQYVNKCALCIEIRQFLVVERQLNSNDLQPVYFYQSDRM